MSKRVSLWVAAFWVATLVVGSLLPTSAKVAMRTTSGIHRVVHFAAFGATAVLLVSIVRTPGQKLLALLAVAAIGASLEALQHLIYKCQFEVWDLRDDTIAAVAGYFVGCWKAAGAWIRPRVIDE